MLLHDIVGKWYNNVENLKTTDAEVIRKSAKLVIQNIYYETIKKTIKDYYDLDESLYQELKEMKLLPDRSEESYHKLEELYQRGKPFTSEELWFIGSMDVVRLHKFDPSLAQRYMDNFHIFASNSRV